MGKLMKIRILLVMIFCLLGPTLVGMKKIKVKPEKFESLKFQSYSKNAFNKNIFSRKSHTPIRLKSDIPTQQKIAIPQQTWWNKLTNFLTFKKIPSRSAEATPHTNFFRTKIETEQQEHNQKTPYSYWQWIKGLIGAALVGGTVATMQDNEDPLSQPEFEDLRKFIESVRDPELEKKWNLCKANPECNQIICNADFVTIINNNNHPSMVLKGYEFDRVINAKIAEKVIKENNLDLIAIPKKTILFDGEKWKVVTEQIKGVIPPPLSLEQVQQLAEFSKKTGFWDWNMYVASDTGFWDWSRHDMWNKGNIIFDPKSGKLFIIDTEDRSFTSLENHTITGMRRLKKWMSPEARKWIETQIDLGTHEVILGKDAPKRGLDFKKFHAFDGFDLELLRTQAAELQNKHRDKRQSDGK